MKSKGRSKIAAGHRFEQSVLKHCLNHMPSWTVLGSVWFAYEADADEHMCEIDILLTKGNPDIPDKLVVIECKLSETNTGIQELRQLYMPVLQAAYLDTPVSGALVFKYATGPKWKSGLTESDIDLLGDKETGRFKL